jgi:hypothetical protein
MNIQEIQNKIEEDFGKFLEKMEREEILFAEKGKERLRFVIYRSKGDKNFPLKKVAFMILDYGLVWNKDDKTALDDDELIVGCFKTADDLPLPILAVEVSTHIGKYDHMNADLFPISQDPRYRETFCTPTQALCKKHISLPGVPPGAITPNLPQNFTSGGMMSGDFDLSLRDNTFAWWFGYIDLFRHFLENREAYPILRETAIVEEAQKTRAEFLNNFAKGASRILGDLPNLDSPEKGVRLGELMFLDD